MEIFIALLAETPPEPLTLEQWLALPQSMLAVGAALAGWASFAASWRSGSIAKENLRVAKQSLNLNTTAANDANKCVELDFTYAVELRRPQVAAYVFDVELTNPATNPNTVKNARLTLIFNDGAERSFDPKPLPPEMEGKNPLVLPVELSKTAHKAGSIAFEVPLDLFRGRHIRRYRIDVTDVRGRVSEVETIAVNLLGGNA